MGIDAGKDTRSAVDLLVVPEGIRQPVSIQETVQVCNQIFQYGRSNESEKVDVFAYLDKEKDNDEELFDVASLVPEEYVDLAKWLESVYEKQYELGESYTLDDPYAEAVFQQLQIILDKEKERSNVNSVGLYAPSYVDALVTAKYPYWVPTIYEGKKTGNNEGVVDNRFLGANEDFAEEKAFRAVLLGCSSITSASDFGKMISGMNPKAESLIIDNDPVSVALSEHAGVTTVLDDALVPEHDVQPADLIMTNFLISSMPEEERIDAYHQLFFAWKDKVYPKTGRLVLVEQILESDAPEIRRIAYECGFQTVREDVVRTDRYESSAALRYADSSDVDEHLDRLSEDLKPDEVYFGENYSNQVDTMKVEGVTTLVFQVG